MGLHRLAGGESAQITAVKRIGPRRLDGGDTRQVSNQTKLICLQQGFAEGRCVAQITGGQRQPVGSQPVELLQDFKTNGFLPLDTVGIERIEQVDAQLMANLLDQRSEERRVGKECRSRWSPY